MPASAPWWWGAASVSDQPAQLDLSTAEAALERGDYGQCLELLTRWRMRDRCRIEGRSAC